jgi:6-phosphogluconate dehydrogenase
MKGDDQKRIGFIGLVIMGHAITTNLNGLEILPIIVNIFNYFNWLNLIVQENLSQKVEMVTVPIRTITE